MKEIISAENFQKDFSYMVLSHSILNDYHIFKECSFFNADINGAHFSNVTFLECCFKLADMANAEFIDCTFVDCDFDTASLSSSSLYGCYFEYGKNYSGKFRASLSSAIISSSKSRRSLFKNVLFKDMSFRNVSMMDTDFENCRFEEIPYENAIFSGCNFDKFDFLDGTSKGVRISDCEIGEFNIYLERIFSVIGVLDVLKKSTFNVYINTKSGPISISDLDELYDPVESALDSLCGAGALYEYINGSLFIKELGNGLNESSRLEYLGKSVRMSNLECLEKSFEKFSFSMEKSSFRLLSLANISFALDILIENKLFSEKIHRDLYHYITKISHKKSSSQVIASVYFKLEKLSRIKDPNNKCLVFKESFDTPLTLDKSFVFSNFVSEILMISGLDSYKIVNRREGSVEETILSSLRKIVNDYPKFIGVLFMLGFDCDVSYSTQSGLDLDAKFRIDGISFERFLSSNEVRDKVIDHQVGLINENAPSLQDLDEIARKVSSSSFLQSYESSNLFTIQIRDSFVHETSKISTDSIFLEEGIRKLEQMES